MVNSEVDSGEDSEMYPGVDFGVVSVMDSEVDLERTLKWTLEWTL